VEAKRSVKKHMNHIHKQKRREHEKDREDERLLVIQLICWEDIEE